MIPERVDKVLDVGCGRGIVGALSRIYRQPSYVIGIDIFKPYISSVQKLNLYDELIMCDLRNLPLPFKDKTFDVTICLETIEHLPRHVGLELISEELKRLTKSRIIISTPAHFFTQPAFDQNPHQRHVSFYEEGDFTNAGYRVYGTGHIWFMDRVTLPLSKSAGRLRYYLGRLIKGSTSSWPHFYLAVCSE